jgi:DNA replication protein DnaC
MSMSIVELERTLVQLRLSGARATLQTRLHEAQVSQMTAQELLAVLMQDELDCRNTRLLDKRFKSSALDERPSLAEIDWSFNPKVPRAACFELQTLKFISEGANALLIGQPGTGKSHTAKAVAYHAIAQGLKVAYVETESDFTRYALADSRGRDKQLQKLLAVDLVVLDDLFLAKSIPASAAEFLQTLVHQRYKRRASLVVTSNRVIQDWGTYLGDMTMASTILDRLMHRCRMLQFEGRSYRLKDAGRKLAIKSDKPDKPDSV